MAFFADEVMRGEVGDLHPEPNAFPLKFFVHYLHVHYADDSSFAEAFIQRVESPYQLIVVGDH